MSNPKFPDEDLASIFDAVSNTKFKGYSSVYEYNRHSISQRVLLTVVLQKQVVFPVIPLRYRDTIHIKCPFHNGKHTDSMAINLFTGRATCFSKCRQHLNGADVTEVYYFANRDKFNSRRDAALHLANVIIPTLPKEHVKTHKLSRTIAHGTLPLSPTKQKANPDTIQRVLEFCTVTKCWNGGARYCEFKDQYLHEQSPYKLPEFRKQQSLANVIVPALLYVQNGLWRLGRFKKDKWRVGTPKELQKAINGFCEYQFWCPCLMRENNPEVNNTKGNVLERVYLPLEWDEAYTKDYQATIIMHLRQKWKGDAPLVVVTDSRGSSLHAVWHVRGMAAGKLQQMMDYAIELGCDWVMAEETRWTRLPGGWRNDIEKGIYARQIVHYFNPDFL
jgi:hypothetical protein